MKLLMRHGLGNFGRFILLGCRRSICLRSIHVAPAGCDSSPSAANPRWTMLNTSARRRGSDVADAKAPVADAGCATSTGGHLRISSGLEAPPASSYLYYDWAGSSSGEGKDANDDEVYPEIIAIHGDSVLLGISHRRAGSSFRRSFDYFVYRASPARAASLSLLPVRDFRLECERGLKFEHPRDRILTEETTGLLRRGDDELLVVDLGTAITCTNGTIPECATEICTLRIGGGTEWELKRDVPIVINNVDELRQWSYPNRAVPVGDRFLCWVNYVHGFLLCDMAEASPKLRYVPLPAAPFLGGSGTFSDDEWIERRIRCSRNMCAAGSGGGAVRLVSVDPRCCCGSLVHEGSYCSHSRSAFTVTTWTLSSLSMDEPMAWVKEGVLDCEELWAQPGHEGLPRVPLEQPVVSLENPDVVCFTVYGNNFDSYMDRKAWIIEVDTRSKAILSVYCTTCQTASYGHLPAKLMC